MTPTTVPILTFLGIMAVGFSGSERLELAGQRFVLAY